ncbi:MAG: hypothetical protein EA405_08725 [Rhodospirillales bacterium]|nr:MAG: hypothetical protein EA405_08725 [Rhodospirillales bacterium]
MTVPFKDRWLIRGALTLNSALQLRTGFSEPRKVKGARDAADETAEVALVHRDCDGLPVILGSSLKGVLRSWLIERLPNEKASIESIFGHEPRQWKQDPTKQAGRGGKAEFLDAFIAELPGFDGPFSAVPPLLVGRTAINRETRTAAVERLFQGEQVPATTAFQVEVAGDSLTPHEVALLLAAFDGFNAGGGDVPIALGGGGSHGPGRTKWRLHSVRRMDVGAVYRWLSQPKPRPWREAIVDDPATACDRGALTARANRLLAGADRPGWLALDLRLAFSGPFLVNHPAWVKHKTSGSQHPDFEPMRDQNGRPLLPGSSVKGALRAQAERIYRTVHGEDALASPEESRDGTPRNAVEWLFGVGGEHRQHDPSPGPSPRNAVEWLFGVGGWRGMLTVSDFTEHELPKEPEKTFAEQEFVAIDRFTGGAADGAKFKARMAEAPVLTGCLLLRVSPRRISDPLPGEDHREEPWTPQFAKPALGLMALVLRDLVEGDVTFGFGAAKGFGACTAVIVGPPVIGPAAALQAIFPGMLPHRLELPGGNLDHDQKKQAAKALYGNAIAEALAAFRAGKEPGNAG